MNSGSHNVPGTVSVIDANTNEVIATIEVGNGPEGIAVDPNGTKIFVTNFFSQNVSVIDTATNKVTSTVKIGTYPLGVAVDSNGKTVICD